MKQLLSGIIAAMFVAAISLSTTAQSADTGVPVESKLMGEHAMSGTITEIDHNTGWLSLKTGLGTLQIHYPPPAIKDLQKGESMTAHLGFSTP